MFPDRSLSAEERHNLLFLGPYLEAVSAFHDDACQQGSSSRLVAFPVSVCVRLQLTSAASGTSTSLPNKISTHPLDAFHVAHRWLCHRTAYLHRRQLEVWSILRQVTDSCHECSACDVTMCKCLAVGVIVVRHLRSIPVVTVVGVVPPVSSLSLPLSTSALPLAFIPLHGTWCRRSIRSL